MKVKIGGRIYDSEEIPIMLILSEKDKKLISSMKKIIISTVRFLRGIPILHI